MVDRLMAFYWDVSDCRLASNGDLGLDDQGRYRLTLLTLSFIADPTT